MVLSFIVLVPYLQPDKHAQIPVEPKAGIHIHSILPPCLPSRPYQESKAGQDLVLLPAVWVQDGGDTPLAQIRNRHTHTHTHTHTMLHPIRPPSLPNEPYKESEKASFAQNLCQNTVKPQFPISITSTEDLIIIDSEFSLKLIKSVEHSYFTSMMITNTEMTN